MATSDVLDGLDLTGIRSVAFVIADSLRWDSYAAAAKPHLDKYVLNHQRRFAYASWTQPSHTCLLTGLLPHTSSPGLLAGATYMADRRFWAQALAPNTAFATELAMDFSLASAARRHGWRTIGRVAMPVLHEGTPFSRGFDDYALAKDDRTMVGQVASLKPELSYERDFVFLNVGETHYPYMQTGLPRLSGLNGVLRRTDTDEPCNLPFDADTLKALQAAQVEAVSSVDLGVAALLDTLRKPALLVFASDHGELFGEAGFFGHGPFFHELLFAVPLAFGVVR